MQDEIASEGLAREVALLGVNEKHAVSGVQDMCAGRDLPLLQDTAEADVWGSWNVTYRDVIVLDVENHVVTIYNLTDHDLALPANYEALKAILRAAAGGSGRRPLR
jgi:hypothetical protein